jgi:thiol:disulfide interchange protein DsbD
LAANDSDECWSFKGERAKMIAVRARSIAWRTAACGLAVWASLAVLPILSHAESSPDTNRAASSTVDSLLDQSHQTAPGKRFLTVDEAFHVRAAPDGAGAVRLTWVIAPGYYLYRSRIRVTSANARLGTVELPPGQIKSDAYLGRQRVYQEELVARLPVERTGHAALELKLRIGYQGCAEAGLCYPPTTRLLTVELPPAAPASG